MRHRRTAPPSHFQEYLHAAQEAAHGNQSRGEPIRWTEIGLFIVTGILAWATFQLVLGAEKTAERQLRAYVGPKLFPPNPSMQNPNVVTLRVQYQNYGQTPAYDVGVWFHTPEVFATEATGDFATGVTSGARMVLEPGAVVEFTHQWHSQIVSDNYGHLTGQHLTLYMWGEFRYRDVFDKTRVTRFRVHLPGGEIAQGVWAFCADGNEAT